MTWQMRRDTAANWTSSDPTLAAGEPGWDTTNGVLKIGDGSTAWSSLDSYGGAGGSVWEEAFSGSLASNGDTFDVTGLTGDAYRLTLIWSPVTSSNYPALRLNSASGASDYTRTVFGHDGTARHLSQSRSEYPFGGFASLPTSETKNWASALVYKPAASDHAVIVVRQATWTGGEAFESRGVWSNTASKVTSIQLFGSSGDLAAGSFLRVESAVESSTGTLVPALLGFGSP